MVDNQHAELHLDLTEWNALFALMRGRGADLPRILHTAYSTIGYKDIIQHFESEESPQGKWKPLKYRKGKPLQDTGNLRKSITPSNWRKVSSTGIMVFANAPYGGIHDKGTDKVPQRQFMWLSKDAAQRMAEYVAKFIVDGKGE